MSELFRNKLASMDTREKVEFTEKDLLLTLFNASQHAATKEELTATRVELKAEMQNVRSEIQDVRTELKAEMQNVRSEIQDVRTELKAEIQELRVDIKGNTSDISELKSDMRLVKWMLGVVILTTTIPLVRSLLSVL